MATVAALALAGCANGPASPPSGVQDTDAPLASSAARHTQVADVLWLDRLSFGATASSSRELARMGRRAWLDGQLRPSQEAPLSSSVQALIADMTISRTPTPELVRQLEAQRKGSDGTLDDEQKKAAQQAY